MRRPSFVGAMPCIALCRNASYSGGVVILAQDGRGHQTPLSLPEASEVALSSCVLS